MTAADRSSRGSHDHFFLGEAHEVNERRSWWVVGLCSFMMVAEIVGGLIWGSIALVADGLHMSTHAGALLLAALAYRYARGHANDDRFTFGTGKLGDLAGFASAVVLAMIAILIGYEAVCRFIWPTPIQFREAIPIAALGLAVNVVSVWLLRGGHEHGHGHSHGHGPSHNHGSRTQSRRVALPDGALSVEIVEDGVPPRFRIRFEGGARMRRTSLETVRADRSRQVFHMAERGDIFESIDEVPEPHAFSLCIRFEGDASESPHRLEFVEDDVRPHGRAERAALQDNNMRSALVHILADLGVSVLVIIGLLLARSFGLVWMDPTVGLVGAFVIALWSFGLIRDSGAILLDMRPDRVIEHNIRRAVEGEGVRLTDLHVWRLGPGHLGAIVCLETSEARSPQFYKDRLARFRSLSHVTVEIEQSAQPS